MKPKQAKQYLNFIIENQKTVSTNRIKDLVHVINSESKMLAKDNDQLRKKIRRQRNVLRRAERSK